MRLPVTLIALLFTTPAIAGTDLMAEENYALSIAGIEIGEATLSLNAEGDAYQIKVDGGYSFLFWSGAAQLESKGLHDGEGFSPRSYRSRLISSTREVTTEIDFDGAGVSDASFVSDPPLDPEEFGNRVPMKDGDLLGVFDPISAFMIRATSGKEACDSLLPVFSGIVRFDLKLSASEDGDMARPVCVSDYRPISGHRVESGEVDRLRGDGVEVALFEIAPDLWAPDRVGFRTTFGTLALERKAE